MDIYSDLRIPYSVGVWARSHKFNPIAIRLAKDLQSIANRKYELERAEQALDQAERNLKETIETAEQALAKDSHGY